MSLHLPPCPLLKSPLVLPLLNSSCIQTLLSLHADSPSCCYTFYVPNSYTTYTEASWRLFPCYRLHTIIHQTQTSLLSPMLTVTFIFPAFTFISMVTKLKCHSVAAIRTRSSAYSSSHGSFLRHNVHYNGKRYNRS